MQVFWIEIDKIKYSDLFEQITKFEDRNIVFTPNPEILLKTLTDREFKNLINKATYRTSDGIWLYLAYQILDEKGSVFALPYYIYRVIFEKPRLYKKYGERICWSDLTKDLVAFANENDIEISIIDLYNPTDLKKVESQKAFVKILKKTFPKLKFDYYIYNSEKKDEIIEKIKSSNSKILFSTLWMKKQEQSVVEIMEACENIKIWLWIGSSFDYFIGFQKRAPKLWRDMGLEWLYRLITWPRKIDRIKRLWSAIFVFTWKVISEKLIKSKNNFNI